MFYAHCMPLKNTWSMRETPNDLNVFHWSKNTTYWGASNVLMGWFMQSHCTCSTQHTELLLLLLLCGTQITLYILSKYTIYTTVLHTMQCILLSPHSAIKFLIASVTVWWIGVIPLQRKWDKHIYIVRLYEMPKRKISAVAWFAHNFSTVVRPSFAAGGGEEEDEDSTPFSRILTRLEECCTNGGGGGGTPPSSTT